MRGSKDAKHTRVEAEQRLRSGSKEACRVEEEYEHTAAAEFQFVNHKRNKQGQKQTNKRRRQNIDRD